jgi:glycine C-acetyltransferase
MIHGFSTLGETGAGAGEEQEFKMILSNTSLLFAKSMANIGAFVAADKRYYCLRNIIYVLKCLQKHYYDSNCRFIETIRLLRNKELKNKL